MSFLLKIGGIDENTIMIRSLLMIFFNDLDLSYTTNFNLFQWMMNLGKIGPLDIILKKTISY